MQISEIAVPQTYSEWVAVLDILKAGSDDEAVLSAMQKGKIEWQSGVAERFIQKLIDAINARMNLAVDQFQTAMSRSRGEERLIVQALLALRREFCFLSKAIDLPAIPQKDRASYVRLILDQADQVQKSLADSAKQDHSGKLASIVRNHQVNEF